MGRKGIDKRILQPGILYNWILMLHLLTRHPGMFSIPLPQISGGEDRQRKTKKDKARESKTKKGKKRQRATKQDKVRQSKTKQDKARQSKTKKDKERQKETKKGEARQRKGKTRKKKPRDVNVTVAPPPGNAAGFVGPGSDDVALYAHLRGSRAVSAPPGRFVLNWLLAFVATGPIARAAGATD